MNGFGMTPDGSGYGFAAIECGVKINDDGTFGLYFDRLNYQVLTVMMHPGLVANVMPQVWEAADEKGIELQS